MQAVWTLEAYFFPDGQVVEPASAILGTVNELRAVPINADHRNMVIFPRDEPEKYRPVKNGILDLMNKIPARMLACSLIVLCFHLLYDRRAAAREVLQLPGANLLR